MESMAFSDTKRQYESELWNRIQDTGESSWRIEQEGFEPSRERELETIFSIGNGYLGVRGALMTPIPTSQPDFFIAGIYAQKMTVLPYSEIEFKTHDRSEHRYVELVPFPSPFRLSFTINGSSIDPENATLTHFERILDMKRGAFHEVYHYIDENGLETRLRSCRSVSMEDPHFMIHDLEIEAINHSERVDIDTDYLTSDYTLQHPHLKQIPISRSHGVSSLHFFETKGSKFRIGIATRILCEGHEKEKPSFQVALTQGKTIRIQRAITIFTSRDGESPEMRAIEDVRSKDWKSFDRSWHQIESSWRRFWDISDIRFDGRQDLTQAQRFNSYQLRIGASFDSRTSVAARTLTGRSYEGHIFWDCEIFAFPFYLYTEPAIARSLLLYRYHTMDGARQRAAESGQKGASFAWESTVTGEDVTPKKIIVEGTSGIVPIFTGTQQIHVTADIAHAIAKYWRATHDAEFMRDYGTEVLIETARFWAGRVTERERAYHLDEVVGPDEYHHSVNDNFYTNWMARENLKQTIWAHAWIQRFHPETFENLCARLGLRDEEAQQWHEISQLIYIPSADKNGVIEQFEGYFDLKDAPLNAGEILKAPISRLLNWKEINASKLIKQADVLMIPFLFPNALPKETVQACFDYYEPKTDHGSSLSPCVHAAVAAQLGLRKKAVDYWQTSLNLDLFNIMGNSGLGFHSACAGGTWQSLVFHMCRIVEQDGSSQSLPSLQQIKNPTPPVLPPDCERVRLNLIHLGKLFRFEIAAGNEGETAGKEV